MEKPKIQLSTKKEINKSISQSINKINKNISSQDKDIIRKIDNNQLKDTKSQFTTKKGNYFRERLQVHNKIINKNLKKDTKSKNPDLYFFGGVGGSGKSGLNKFVKERAITVNNDDIKKDLTKYSKSPSKRFKLIHASLLHREAKDIEDKLIKKIKKQRKDAILDRTLSDYEKNLNLAKKFKLNKYRVHTFGTSLKPHLSIKRATNRFLKGKEGRYVPVSKIGTTGNTTNKNVVRMAKNKINKSSVIINTTKRRPTLILSKNISKLNLKKAINKIAIMNKAKPRTTVKRVPKVQTQRRVKKVVSKPIKRVSTKRSKK